MKQKTTLLFLLIFFFSKSLLVSRNTDYVSDHIKYDRIFYLDENYNFNEKDRYSTIVNEEQVDELYVQQNEFYKMVDDRKLLLNKTADGISLNIFHFAELSQLPDILLKEKKYLDMELYTDLAFDIINSKKLKADNGIICDFHIHTVYSHDSASDIVSLLKKSSEKGFGAIAIADHNRMDGVRRTIEISEHLKKEKTINPDFIIIPAEEISVNDGSHIGAIFINTYIEKGMTAEETIREIHKQGGLAIALHPGKKTELGIKLARNLDFDAVEVGNSSDFLPYDFYRNKSLNKKLKKTKVFGNNTHMSQGIGFLGYNVVFTDNKSIEGIKESVAQGKVKPVFTGLYYGYYNFFEFKPVDFLYSTFDIYDTVKRNLEYSAGKLLFSNDFTVKTTIDDPLYDIFNVFQSHKYINKKDDNPFRQPVKFLYISISYGMFNVTYNFPEEKTKSFVKFMF
ncbi:MAG: PHP domain-containing protein [Elusimicrobia bacterium]|nr:PHP domain-containing protein [Elusimicrobiota bacterium]